jgi:hypothetical protein
MKYALMSLVVILLTACQKDSPGLAPTTVSPVPAITFTSLSKTQVVDKFGNRLDSIAVTITYQDGDADLGLSYEDADRPYNRYTEEGTLNRFFYNYYIDLYRKKNNGFEPVPYINMPNPFNGRFPKIFDESGKSQPGMVIGGNGNPFLIHTKTASGGELTYSFYLAALPPGVEYRTYVPTYQGDTLKCGIQITDRALNLSNTIETAEFVLSVY